MVLNFRNILELYGIQAGSRYQESFSLEENADLFGSIFDINEDGEIDKDAEYKAYLISIGLPEHMANNFFALYDTNGDGKLDATEVQNAINSLDTDGDGILQFEEALKFYNDSAALDLDTASTSFTQYINFFEIAKANMLSMDSISENQIVDDSEYASFLYKNNLQGRYGSDFADLFDTANDGVDFEEFMKKFVEWDKNNDGYLDYTNDDPIFKEADDYYNLFTEARLIKRDFYKPEEFKNILNIFNVGVYGQSSDEPLSMQDNAQALVDIIDTDQDGIIHKDEFNDFLYDMGLTKQFGNNLYTYFDADANNQLDATELENKLSDFDTDGNDKFDFEEGLGFFNRFSNSNPISISTFYSIDHNAEKLLSIIDTGHDGLIDKDTEYKDFLAAINVPTVKADILFGDYDANNDDNLTVEELKTALSAYDIDAKASLNAEEWEEFFEYTSGHTNYYISTESLDNIESAFEYYSKHFSVAQSLILNFDDNKDGVLDNTAQEAGAALESVGIPDSYINDFINLFDSDSDGNISFEEYLKQNLEWDLDKDGSIELYDTDNPEGAAYLEFMPDMLAQYDPESIEYAAQQLILYTDRYENLEIEAEEYELYLTQGFGFPKAMAQELIAQYDTDSSGSVDFDELVAAYSIFDTLTVDDDGNEPAGADGKLSFKEMIEFQNSLTVIDIDTTAISEEQFAGLFNMATSVIRSMDDDIDGELTVEEYRAVLKQMYEPAGLEVPLHVAENFIRAFDLDKNGTVNINEAVNKYAQYDENADGILTANEISDLQAKLEDTRLFDTVNAEIIDLADKDNNAKINMGEYSAYLEENGHPAYIADDAFNLFDRNLDGQLSRLEFMEAFSRYDNNVENEAHITALEPGYVLYTGDRDNRLDRGEKLKMFEDLAAADYGVNFGVDPSKSNQYEPIMDNVEELVKNLDFNRNGLIDSAEYRDYLVELGLPDYIADHAVDNALVSFDLRDDDALDYIEWMQIHLDFDNNENGIIEYEEEFGIYDAVSNVNLGINATNAEHYSNINDSAKEIIEQFDTDSNKILDQTEITNFFRAEGMSDDSVTQALAAYDVDGAAGPEHSLDMLELMKMYYDYDSDRDGDLNDIEKLALFDGLAGTGLNPNLANTVQLTNVEENIDSLIQKFDVDSDKKLNAAELQVRMRELGLPDYIAAETIAGHDLDSDGNLDKLEFIKAKADVDNNNNGILEFNEEMALYSAASGANLTPTPDEITQYNSLYNRALALFNQLDNVQDRILTTDGVYNELSPYFTGLNLPKTMADDIINNPLYDLNGDSGIDIYEWVKIQESYDKNDSGIIEADEQLEMLGNFANPTIRFNMTDSSQAELYNYAVNIINQIGGADKNLSGVEFRNWLKDYWGITDDMANRIVTHYDTATGNSDGALNTLEFAKALIDIDDNTNGVWDRAEIMNFIDNALPSVDLGGIDDSNLNQVWGLCSYAIDAVNNIDSDSNKKLSSTEFRNWLKDYWGITDDMATRIINHYDLDTDGQMDIMEFTKGLLDLDTNANGAWDIAEIMNFIDNGSANILPQIEEDNFEQFRGLFNYSKNIVNYAALSDKLLQQAEYEQYLIDAGFSGVDASLMATNAITLHDTDANGLDTYELMDALFAFDSNNNGVMESDELNNFYNSIS